MKAIVFGATGMVGEGVLHVALGEPAVGSVLVIGRRSCDVHHLKLTELVRDDFFDYADVEDRLRGYDACFFCLGVSSIGMNEKDYTRVTYDLTMAAARVLSRSMWARVKGKTENDLAKLPFKASYAFRPGFIKPIKGLRHAFTFARILGAAYPAWKTLFPRYVCTLEDLGLAMVQVAREGSPAPIVECEDIARLAARRRERQIGDSETR
jgi:uncharacterized protein YbjT (DUF2867 family)